MQWHIILPLSLHHFLLNRISVIMVCEKIWQLQQMIFTQYDISFSNFKKSLEAVQSIFLRVCIVKNHHIMRILLAILKQISRTYILHWGLDYSRICKYMYVYTFLANSRGSRRQISISFKGAILESWL